MKSPEVFSPVRSRWQFPACAALVASLVLVGAPAGSAQEAPVAATWKEIPQDVWDEMTGEGKSWREGLGCLERDQLRLLTVPYFDFNGEPKTGELVVAETVVGEVAKAFEEIYKDGRFRIEKMERIDEYAGDDDASMAANNTSAFNCRYVGGTTTLSPHGLGIAIDINPLQNPLVTKTKVYPPTSQYGHKRPEDVVGIIVEGDVVTTAFANQGWKWGGNWTNKKDYQHFSKNGR